MAIQEAENTHNGPTEQEMTEWTLNSYIERNDTQFRYCQRVFGDLNPNNDNLETLFGVHRNETSLFEDGKQRLQDVCESYENEDPDWAQELDSGSGVPNMALNRDFDRMSCRHVVRVFGIQYHQFGRDLRVDNDHMCIVMVENVVSEVEEPKCMEWMEMVGVELHEIMYDAGETATQMTAAWPYITTNTHFDDAALAACNLMDMDDCENMIQQVKLIEMDESNSEQANHDYIEAVCSTSGLSLLQYPGARPRTQRARRNQLHAIYHKIAEKQAKKEGVEFKPLIKRTRIPALYQGLKRAEQKEKAPEDREDQESAARRLLGSSGSARRRRSWNQDKKGGPYDPTIEDLGGAQYRRCDNMGHPIEVCGEAAATIELGVSVSAGGIMLGGALGLAFGWTENVWHGQNAQTFKMGLYQDYGVICAGQTTDPDPGASAAFAAGYMQTFQAVGGWSRTHEVAANFWIFTAAIGAVECCEPGWVGCSPCGAYTSLGVTLPGVPPAGIDFSRALCYTIFGVVDGTRHILTNAAESIYEAAHNDDPVVQYLTNQVSSANPHRRRRVPTITDYGSGGSRRRMGQCQGDCDEDSDCSGSLKCFQRQQYAPVPGCNNGRNWGDTIGTLQSSCGANGCSSMGQCQGDCDNDDDCAGDLGCFQRDGLTPVPGCSGEGVNDYDYCTSSAAGHGRGVYEHDYCTTGLDSSPGSGGGRRRSMTMCQGDCDTNADCSGSLKCYQRDKWDPVPGCAGGGEEDYDYCTTQSAPCERGVRCPLCFAAQEQGACNDECFPADATVTTPGGEKLMQELRVGDQVLTTSSDGTLIFEDVYFFGHANAEAVRSYLTLGLEGASAPLEITGKHFVPLCPVTGQPCEYSEHVYKYAQETVHGDHLWVAGTNSTVELARVKEIGRTVSKGLFNPYTLGGTIIVNNVLASAHSNWVLDGLVPSSATGYLPSIYQALFTPGRVLYHVFGASAATALDVNSPQQQEFGHGPQFLVASLLLPPIILLFTKRLS